MLDVRPAGPQDAPAAAEVFLAARAGMTYLPELHTDEETRRFIADVVVGSGRALVATDGTGGSAVLGAAWWSRTAGEGMLDGLYVSPGAQGRGIGAALFEAVARILPSGFRLWVFQDNTGARRFYQRRGATLVRETDGRDNEERLPDALLEWEPAARPVRLRAVLESDVPLLYEQQADPEACAMAVMRPKGRAEHEAHLHRVTADPTAVLRAVVTSDGMLVGTVGSWSSDGDRLVGYQVGREHWGRGLATAALQAFLDEVHDRPISAHAAQSNLASRRVLHKCGFEEVAVLEESGDPPVTEVLARLER